MKAPDKEPTEGHVPLPQLWQIAAGGQTDQLAAILDRGADVNAFNSAGLTALMVAAYHGQTEMVKALIEHGADVNAAGSDGLTAAMIADEADHGKIVRILVGHAVKRKPSPTEAAVASIESSAEEPPVAKAPEIRTLHEPPDIWDMVHETQTDFSVGSAFWGRLAPRKLVAPAAILLLLAAMSVFGFKMLPRWMGRDTASSATRNEGNDTKTKVNSVAPQAKAVSAASKQLPVRESPRPESMVSTIFNPKNIKAGVSGLRSAAVVTAPQPSPTVLPVRDNLAAHPLEERGNIQKTTLQIAKLPTTAPKRESPRNQVSVKPGLPPDNDRRTNPATIKKDAAKATAPELSTPKPNPSPRGKVIQWP